MSPLHTINESSTLEEENTLTKDNAALTKAKRRFSELVGNGIAVLMQQHGFSRERAVRLVLGEINLGGVIPSEDKVFNVMRKYAISIDDATKVLSVAEAMKSAEISGDSFRSPIDAIEYISSRLTVMKLLAKVENQDELVSLVAEESYHSDDSIQFNNNPREKDISNNSVSSMVSSRPSTPISSKKLKSSSTPSSTIKNSKVRGINNPPQNRASKKRSNPSDEASTSSIKSSTPLGKRLLPSAQKDELVDNHEPNSHCNKRSRLDSF